MRVSLKCTISTRAGVLCPYRKKIKPDNPFGPRVLPMS